MAGELLGNVCKARIATETEWGTDPAGGTNIPLAIESSLANGLDQQFWDEVYAHNYPNKGGKVFTGQDVKPTWRTPIFPEIKDFIDGCVTRTSDVLPTYTLEKVWGTTGSTLPAWKALGCKCNTLTITSSKNDPLVIAELAFIGKSLAEGTLADLTPAAVTTPMLTKNTAITLAGSAVTGSDNCVLTIDQQLIVGPRDANGEVEWIKENWCHPVVELNFPLKAKTYVTELVAKTRSDITISVVFSNGLATGASTLTYACNYTKLINNPLNDEAVNATQMYTLRLEAHGAWTLVAA